MQTGFPDHWGNRQHFEHHDGYWWCILCHKWSSDGHIQSRKHQNKVDWEESDWMPVESGGRQVADSDSCSIPELTPEAMYDSEHTLLRSSRLADVHYPSEASQQSDVALSSLLGGCTLQQARPQQKQGRNKISVERHAAEARFVEFPQKHNTSSTATTFPALSESDNTGEIVCEVISPSESPPVLWRPDMESTRSHRLEPKAPPPPSTLSHPSNVVAPQSVNTFALESPSLALASEVVPPPPLRLEAIPSPPPLRLDAPPRLSTSREPSPPRPTFSHSSTPPPAQRLEVIPPPPRPSTSHLPPPPRPTFSHSSSVLTPQPINTLVSESPSLVLASEVVPPPPLRLEAIPSPPPLRLDAPPRLSTSREPPPPRPTFSHSSTPPPAQRLEVIPPPPTRPSTSHVPPPPRPTFSHSSSVLTPQPINTLVSESPSLVLASEVVPPPPQRLEVIPPPPPRPSTSHVPPPPPATSSHSSSVVAPQTTNTFVSESPSLALTSRVVPPPPPHPLEVTQPPPLPLSAPPRLSTSHIPPPPPPTSSHSSSVPALASEVVPPPPPQRLELVQPIPPPLRLDAPPRLSTSHVPPPPPPTFSHSSTVVVPQSVNTLVSALEVVPPPPPRRLEVIPPPPQLEIKSIQSQTFAISTPKPPPKAPTFANATPMPPKPPPKAPPLELSSTGIGCQPPPPTPYPQQRPFQQMVHVLLRSSQSMFFPKSDIKYTVGVMGLHRSGTHALLEYVKRYFDVDWEPQPRKSCGDGNLLLAHGFQIWKHTIPLQSWNLPEVGSTGGHLIVLLSVRDVMSWMTSLSKHAYEIFPMSKCKRAKGQLWWMLDPVEVTTSTGCFADPFKDSRFSSVPALWVAYVQGYLSAAMSCSANPSATTFVVVRHEDIVLRPGDIVNDLGRLGLPRNQVPFTPIETNVTAGGFRGDGRDMLTSSILENRAMQHFTANAALLDRLREQLKPHSRLFDILGYTFPW